MRRGRRAPWALMAPDEGMVSCRHSLAAALRGAGSSTVVKSGEWGRRKKEES